MNGPLRVLNVDDVYFTEVKSEAAVTKGDVESPNDPGYTIDTLLFSGTPTTATTTTTTSSLNSLHSGGRSPDVPDMKETLHLLLARLQEKRRDAARPEDLSVSSVNFNRFWKTPESTPSESEHESDPAFTLNSDTDQRKSSLSPDVKWITI